MAATYAGLELGLGLLIGGFFAWGRAEALTFHAFRPWLLLGLALLATRFPARERAASYAAALMLAGTAESLFLIGLGATNPWPEMLRGLAAGGVLLLMADLVLQGGRRLWGRSGLILAGLLLMMLLVLVWPRLHDRLLIGKTPTVAVGDKPDLLLMTSLPIIWGEGGAFDPESRPAAAYRALQRAFDVRPIDALSSESLAAGDLMLLAQPRALAPEELATLDAWVRGGGNILILTDPLLMWPTQLPIGDVRRPPPVGLLDPLLAHWGLELRPPARAGIVIDHFVQDGALRRLALAGPGRFESRSRACNIARQGYAARCRIGQGSALLVADADLLADGLWVAPIEGGDERHARTADNPLVLANWLDGLSGTNRNLEEPVQWRRPGSDSGLALLLALLPILATGVAAAAVRRRSGTR